MSQEDRHRSPLPYSANAMITNKYMFLFRAKCDNGDYKKYINRTMFYNMLIIIDIIFQGRRVIAPKSLTPLSSKSMGRQPIAVSDISVYQARAQSVRARRACALRALGLLLADGTPTVGGGKTF